MCGGIYHSVHMEVGSTRSGWPGRAPRGRETSHTMVESPLCTFKKKWVLQNKRKHNSRKRKKGLRRPHRKSCPRNRHTHALPYPPRKPPQLKPDAWELGLSVGEITDPWGCSNARTTFACSCDIGGDSTRAQ